MNPRQLYANLRRRPYGNLNWKPMSPRTRKKVQYTRHAQLFLRNCELLGALGLLFCVICIKGTQGSTGWIIRVPVRIIAFHVFESDHQSGGRRDTAHRLRHLPSCAISQRTYRSIFSKLYDICCHTRRGDDTISCIHRYHGT